MKTDKRYFEKVFHLLEECYPEAKTALEFETPHQLLVATILSAQCTDKRVNLVTKELFKRYASVEAFAGADSAELESYIHSTGFYRQKAKSIIAASKLLVDNYHGCVPETMAELITLPGVARKTANVVLSEAFHRQEGIAVDTHVIRLAQLLGLASSSTPDKIEAELMANIPREKWGLASNLLILHGRNVCVARRPKCSLCKLNKLCPAAFSPLSR
jgi:endonuclease-3